MRGCEPLISRQDALCTIVLAVSSAAASYRASGLVLWHVSDMAFLLRDVRSQGAGSTGRRNTDLKSLCWCFKLQGFTWSFV